MVITVWNSFLSMLRSGSKLGLPTKRRRFIPRLGEIEQVEERVLLAGDLSLTDAYLSDSAGVRLPVGTFPVVGEAVYVRIDWNEAGLTILDNYQVGFQLNQYLMNVGPSGPGSTTYQGTTTNHNLSSTQFVGYARAGNNSILTAVDITATVDEIDEDPTDNSKLFSFIAADPVDPLSTTPFPQPLITPVTGVPYQDWFIYFADSDPRPAPLAVSIADYQGNPLATQDQRGDNYTVSTYDDMDDGRVTAVAAAPGTVTAVVDGNFDRNTTVAPRVGNSVRIDIGNSWELLYTGFLSGSITVKTGDVVRTNDVLGLLGGSGEFNRAHINLQLFHNGVLVNPNYAPSTYFESPLQYPVDAPFSVTDFGITNVDPAQDISERAQDYSTFSVGGSARAWLWFAGNRYLPTEPLTIDWIRPNGQIAATATLTPAAIGTGTFIVNSIPSSVYGSAVGTWQVAVTASGAEVLRGTFNVAASAGAPEIRVQQELPLGANRYLLNDRTTPVDYGVWSLGDPNPDITYTIQNTGATTLTLSNPVMPTGFTLLSVFPSSIAAGGSAQFTVRLNTANRGQSFGNITFTTNDPDEAKFRFAVTGIVNLPLIGPDVDLPRPALRYLYQMFPQDISPSAQFVSVVTLGASSSLQVTFAAGGRSEDNLGIRNQGTTAGLIGVSGSNVTYGGTTIGSFVISNDAVSGAKKLVVSFNANVTQVAATALMRNITYYNPTVLPNTHPRYVQFLVIDQGGRSSDLPVAVIDVVPDTHPPTVSLNATPVSVPGTVLQLFQVVYQDEVSVDASTLDALDLQFVRGPVGNTFPPKYNGKDSNVNDLQRITDWQMDGPGGFWDIRDNGVYEVVLDQHQVKDINGNETPPQVVGTFTINLPNVPATITNTIGGQFTLEDTPTAPIAITVTDLESDVTDLVLSATSSNLSVVAANGFSFSGTGANRSLVINPVLNAFGTTTITLLLQDEHGGNTTKSFLLTVTSVNDLPVVSPIVDQDIQQDTSTSTLGFTVTDVETAVASLVITATSDNLSLVTNNNIVIGGTPANPTVTVTPEPGQFGIANITLEVTDVDGGVTSSVFEILIRENSQPPVIPLNQVLSVPENSSVDTNVGTIIATDADVGQTLTYAITGGDPNSAFTIVSTTGQLKVRSTPLFDFETLNQYTLTISVTDNSFPGVTTTGTVRVNITDVNEIPVVANKTVNINENPPNGQTITQVTATDVDAGQTRTFSIFSGNPNNAFVINPNTGVLTVNNSTAVDFDTMPTIVLTIAVTDNGTPNLTGFGTVTINLGNVNEAPTINPQSFSIAENTFNGVMVGTVIAADPDNAQTLQYVITGGNADGAFAINASSGVITVANSAALNFEVLAVHQLTVRVSDNVNPSLSASNTVTITLTDVNEPPVIAAQTFSIDENSVVNTPVGNVLVNNPEAGQTLTFSISAGNSNNAFAIDPLSGALRVANSAALNFESVTKYTLTIQATDNGSPVLSGSGTITINLNDLNESPLLVDQVFSTNENLQQGVTAATVAASDPDNGQMLTFAITNSSVPGVFAINPQTGALTIASAAGLNFEVNPQITLTVQATDNGGAPLATSATITVNLQNVNDAPVVTAQTFTIAENQMTGFGIGLANATDEDLPAQTLTYSIVGGNTGGAFTIDPSTGQIAVANVAAVDFESTPQFLLQVQARDNGSPPQSGVGIVTINLSDVNEPPLVPNQSLVVPENSPVGFLVGTVVVNNPETSQTLTYEVLSGNQAGAFTVDPANGQVRVANSTLLDFENPQTFVLFIEVTDNGSPSLSRTGELTITIGDVNEFPVFPTPYVFTINENTASGTVLGTLQATDPDNGQTLLYSIVSGNQGNPFVLNPTTGVLSVGQSSLLDFETQPVFTLTVQALDNGTPRRVTNHTVTINLLDVNDPPKISGQAFQLDENSPNQSVVGTIAANDPDVGQSISFQILSGNLDGAFTIDPVSGILRVANSTALDFEARPTFNLVVRVTDTASPVPAISDANVTVSLRNLNEPPLLIPQTLEVGENSPQGTFVGTVLAPDGEPGQSVLFTIESGNTNGTFAINSNSGVLTVTNPALLDFETHPSFALVIKATDNANPPLSRTAVVTVNVQNVNEKPQLANQILTIAENTPNDTVVGQVTAFDPDGTAGLQYAIIAGNFNDAFRIDSLTGELIVNHSELLNYEQRQVIVLTVRVTDPQSSFSTASVTINLTNVNDAPDVTDKTFTIAENSPFNTILGDISALEQDVGQSIMYSILSGNTNGAFAIHPATGRITVANPSALDFETTPTFQLVIRASDNGAPSAFRTATATINLVNVDEPIQVEFRSEATPVRSGQKNVVIDPEALVSEPESPDTSLLGSTLTVSLSSDGSSRADRLGLLTGINGLTVQGKNMYRGGVRVATIVGGRRGVPLFISFSEEATVEDLQEVFRSITVSLGRRHSTDTLDVKFRLSGAPGVGGEPTIKTLTFVQPLSISAASPSRRRK